MTDNDFNLTPEETREDKDPALRPQTLNDFIGQSDARANLGVFIEAARQREGSMDHVLFYGPPGLGKTTLAKIIGGKMHEIILIIFWREK